MKFDDLTWEDLKEWAGSRVVSRGKGYRHSVEDLCRTADGRLLAWVQGGDRYATAVSLSKSGKLSSICTCPYGLSCKHAVAMVLTYLDKIQAGESIPAAGEEDERFERLAEERGLDDEDDEEGQVLPPLSVPSRTVKRKAKEDPHAAASRYLEALPPAALLEFAKELAADFPDVRRRILDRAELVSGDVAKLIASTRREIENVSAEPGWTRHWSNERHIPDYSRVRERLETLLAGGHADAVVAAGEEILQRGIRQVGMSDDEGETGREIAGCMEVVFRAVNSSSLTGAKRLLWEIDARLRDQYCILDGIRGMLEDETAFTPADWSIAADHLKRRMEGISVGARGETGDSYGGHRRQTLMRWLLDALNRASRRDEITDILVREAELTHCYVELVDHLLAIKQKDAAVTWARKGFERTIDKLPGIAWSLEERLRDLAARSKDQPLAAAFRVMEFVDQPELGKFEAIRKAVEPLGLWATIRPLLLNWLETGKRPDAAPVAETPRKGRRKADASAAPAAITPWPLPPTGLHAPGERGRYRSFPDISTLIAIAIQEGRNDEALRWYKQGGMRGGYWSDQNGEKVAAAVQDTHPDEALAIWKQSALAQIALTKPGAYQMAGMSLSKIKTLYERTGRMPEWAALLAELRARNMRKPRMIEVLDGLEGKRTRILKR